jgi:hypothetical protein
MIVTVFGSIGIGSLRDDERARVEKLIALGAQILVSDAPGVDSAVQSVLAAAGYREVKVYHRGAKPRCNQGNWPTVSVAGSYTDKDAAMCKAAEAALAFWDGQSKGTRRNLRQLQAEGKRVRLVQRGAQEPGEGEARPAPAA